VRYLLVDADGVLVSGGAESSKEALIFS
jgi:hypothetical protein